MNLILSLINLSLLLIGSYLVFEAILRMEAEDEKFRDKMVERYGIEGEEYEKY